MPISAGMLAILKSPWHTYGLRFGLLPKHVPVVYTTTDGDTGDGHLATITPVPMLGPNRVCEVGNELIFYAGDSYVRGGLGATGHEFRLYHFPPGTFASDDNYAGKRDSLATQITTAPVFNLLDSVSLQVVPDTAGIYAVELHIDDTVEGDGVTAPLGYAVRFIKVTASGVSDFEGLVDFDGPSGSFSEGGAALSFRYGHPDFITAGRQTLEPWMRLVVSRNQSYLKPDGTIDGYLWEPSGSFDPAYRAAVYLQQHSALSPDR